jgi:MFS superfamily sulfate permease-like transporter
MNFDRVTHVTERRTHDDCFVAVLLVVVVDFLDGLDTGIRISFVSLTGRFLVPIKDLEDNESSANRPHHNTARTTTYTADKG